MNDLALIFPPQWSAFQPPLSLPALAAWMRRAGYAVEVADGNVAFYQWLFSDACRDVLFDEINNQPLSSVDQATFTSLVRALPDFRRSLLQLQAGYHSVVADEQFITDQKHAVSAFETWLSLVSHISNDFSVTPYTFELKNAGYDEASLDRAVEEHSAILSTFFDDFLNVLRINDARSIGISCIGQEQLYFTLLLCSKLRKRTQAPIIIGGTILTRIYERGKLPSAWFRRYFDVIVKNEGEVPCEAMLANLQSGRPLTFNVPGIVYLDGDKIKSSPSPGSLKPRDVPIPDFDGLPLSQYLSPSLTLPILSARGCYWGKCEFCHHGMVYGEKYGAYEVSHLLETVRSLSSRYGASQFSFNDEALPPKIARAIGQAFPPFESTGWTFTALYKFEKFYTKDDFLNLHRAGFRSLYVGMESGSERVLKLMKKPNTLDVVARNLTDARDAGIWTHCFLFFGFPGETGRDAQDTFDFVFENEDIIASVGCGTFTLEHNAPISKHPEEFGIKFRQENQADLSVYYSYDLDGDVGEVEAGELTKRFNERLYSKTKYRSVGWIPRDQLLIFLSRMTPARLVELSSHLLEKDHAVGQSTLSQLFSLVEVEADFSKVIVIDKMTGRVLRLSNNAAVLFRSSFERELKMCDIRQQFPKLYNALVHPSKASLGVRAEAA